ncbi:DUF975 family protein [Lactobacillus helveticus]|uniref:DUF975 family protein n=1 Tax=Lactobacillus helveticus TaxID=1587 RepID=UPI001C646D4D|nr:DUF975 family protein [Lactobacillus helveticus]MBW8013899.1 DUF975 family protein [Lactobacillus helveticus]
MAITRKELKDNAKQALRGNWGWAVIVFLINAIIVGVLSWIGDFFALSLAISFLKLRDNQKEEKPYMAAFSVFTENRFVPECLNFILTSIFTFLWTILLIIPGIIKSYSYSMTAYIVKDMVASGKQVGATDGINASKELMKGHKMDLFIFDLSFIGWFLLGGLTAGIGLLWIVPYYQTAKANFYRHIAGDKFLK